MGRKSKLTNSPVAKNLNKILRAGKGLKENLEAIKRETGIAKSTVRNWLSGNRKAQLGNLEKIAALFHFDVYILYKRVDLPELSPKQMEAMDLIPKVINPSVLEAIILMARAGSLLDDNKKAPPDSEKS